MCLITKCCCFRLKTGGIIIAILDLLCSIISIVGLILALNSEESLEYLKRIPGGGDLVFGIAYITNEVIHILLSILLLCGIKKKKASLISPWLMYTILSYLAATVYVIYTLVQAEAEIIKFVVVTIVYFWISAIFLHFVNTVYSLREKYSGKNYNFAYIKV